MHLFRTICSTDWKGRPSHMINLVASSDDRKWLIERMNEDVREWMCVDLAFQNDEGDEAATADALNNDKTVSNDEIKTDWSHEDRFEMRLYGGSGPTPDHREFVERVDGEFSTTVYHFLADDFTKQEGSDAESNDR